MKLIKEFWPAIRFLLTFVAVYFIANLVYGVYIDFVKPSPDIFTKVAASQTAWVLSTLNEPVSTQISNTDPIVFINRNSKSIINIYEGCNSVNVVIVYAAFILAFAGEPRTKLLFLALGILVINFSNIVRLVLLYFVSLNYQTYFYFLHKYVFTLVLYAIVIAMWLFFVKIWNSHAKTQDSIG